MSSPARKRSKAKPSRASGKGPKGRAKRVSKTRKAARKKATGGAKKKVRRSSKVSPKKLRKVAAKKRRAVKRGATGQSKRGARKAAQTLSRTELLKRYTALLSKEESRERKLERDRDYRARRKELRLELREMLETGQRVLGSGAVSQMLADHHQTEHAFWVEFRREYRRVKR